jgi:ABC-type branched-subunit amino acid transport system substrate-binding protein
MVAAACGSSSNKNGSGGSTTTAAAGGTSPTTASGAPLDTTLGQGVTADQIKVGVALIDWSTIAQFIDFNHGDEVKIDNVFFDAINKAGGIGGRQLVPVYIKYKPIGSQDPVNVCTKFTQDDKVFAVLGNIEDPTGAGQTCVTKNNHTIMIGHDLTDVELSAAPGLMVTPDIAAERRLDVLLNLLKQQKTLAGKTVAIMAEPTTKARIDSDIKPALQAMGVKTGADAVLSITGADTTAAQAQLDSFIERWKTQGVNAIFMTGQDVSQKQFVEKIKKEIPDALLITDGGAASQQAAIDEINAHANPNPYEGMLTAGGLTDEQGFEDPTFQSVCIKPYETATGETVVSPNDLKPGKDGKRVEVYVAISDICRELVLLQDIVGHFAKYPNNTNWVNTVNSLGEITNLPQSQFASIKKDKYDADDADALTAFDSSIKDFKAISPILDASK